MDRVEYSYAEFLEDIKRLCKTLESVKFEAVVAVARGGVTAAHFISEYFDIRNFYIVNAVGYEDERMLDSVKIFNVPKIAGVKSALIVDDIVDSGRSLVEVKRALMNENPNIDFFSAALFYKPRAVTRPDFYLKIADRWIDFFWSVDIKSN